MSIKRHLNSADKEFLKNMRFLIVRLLVGFIPSMIIGMLISGLKMNLYLVWVSESLIESVCRIAAFIRDHRVKNLQEEWGQESLLVLELSIGIELMLTLAIIYILIKEIVLLF